MENWKLFNVVVVGDQPGLHAHVAKTLAECVAAPPCGSRPSEALGNARRSFSEYLTAHGFTSVCVVQGNASHANDPEATRSAHLILSGHMAHAGAPTPYVLLKRMRVWHPTTPLLFVRHKECGAMLKQMVAIGHEQLCAAQDAPCDLIEAVLATLAGQLYVSPYLLPMSDSLATFVKGKKPLKLPADRELQALKLVVKGLSNRQIATELSIKPNTARQLNWAGRTKLEVGPVEHLRALHEEVGAYDLFQLPQEVAAKREKEMEEKKEREKKKKKKKKSKINAAPKKG